MNVCNEKPVLGIIVGNRNFFPDSLVAEGRRRVLEVAQEMGFRVIALSTDDTDYGAVETRDDALRCAQLFSNHRDEIDGVLVTLPNFGDEKAVVEALRQSELDVPVLVHAFPDEINALDIEHRRDAFCGKLSLCNNLGQYGIRFSDTAQHVEYPESSTFKEDLAAFVATCRVVKGLRHARVGAIGARPTAFNTVRFSEKILERVGISVETVDLSEIIARAQGLNASTPVVKREINKIKTYVTVYGVPESSVEKMARLSVVLKNWIEENALDAVAIQCWIAIEALYGIVPCAVMSMLSERLIPNACEMDVMGALSMYAVQLAANKPSALMDWNNNYGDEPDKLIVFHCSNFPVTFFADCKMSYHDLIAGTVGKENTYGTCVGRVSPGSATFFRLSTDDTNGRIVSYLAEGRFTDDEVSTFGGYGVVEIKDLRSLLDVIINHGFEHHIAVVKARVGRVLREAIGKYMDWPLYFHTTKDGKKWAGEDRRAERGGVKD